MPLFYQQDINQTTRAGIWHLTETEDFFLAKVPLTREITHPYKRLQHLGGRFLLPFLFPDFPHAAIEIASTRKPFLASEQYHFSISHCGDYAAAIVSSNQQVGIDIEIITERVHKIKHKFLHPEEQAFAASYPLDQQTRLLTLLWSVKEAMFKWWGRGDIDFSEVLWIDPFMMQDRGIVQAMFQKPGHLYPLQLQYRFKNDLVYVWVATEPI